MQPVSYAPIPDHMCNDPHHSAYEILMSQNYGQNTHSCPKSVVLDRVNLRMLQEAEYTGCVNFVVGKNFDLRMAVDKRKEELADCFLPPNGHEHLSKNKNNDPESVLGVGKAYFVNGEVVSVSNETKAFKIPCVCDTGGYVHMFQVKDAFERKLGVGALDHVEYVSFFEGREECIREL